MIIINEVIQWKIVGKLSTGYVDSLRSVKRHRETEQTFTFKYNYSKIMNKLCYITILLSADSSDYHYNYHSFPYQPPSASHRHQRDEGCPEVCVQRFNYLVLSPKSWSLSGGCWFGLQRGSLCAICAYHW